jgi:HAD superfamily hydrolase (TIGR01509 family)
MNYKDILKKIGFIVGLLSLYGITFSDQSRPSFKDSMHSIDPKINAVLFDFNQVLFDLPVLQILRHLGIVNAVRFWWVWGVDIQKAITRIFDFLSLMRNEQLITVHSGAELPEVPIYKNLVMPTIMQDWTRGHLKTEDFTKLIVQALYDNKSFFINDHERIVFEKLLKIFFDPRIRAQIYRPIKEGIALVEQCKKQGCRIFILSNIDEDIMPLLEEKYPEIFELFDDMVLSADVGMVKPDPAIYEYVLQKYNLDPAATCFFDDEPVNIISACKVGIRGVLFDASKATTVDFKQKISSLGLMT